ncbi:fimbria/pilus outer membrane usher protein [Paraburkholderia sp. J12]|uniref:fimbria/pilus outer membrane usher protein n=1 Tax=Paraburkholderia sp. J12 TaxID=2805432 RepID=UPI002ABEA051|nr:fimbria/pilus outer membrane usher protein [Paraburkholderia sp. J12]
MQKRSRNARNGANTLRPQRIVLAMAFALAPQFGWSQGDALQFDANALKAVGIEADQIHNILAQTEKPTGKMEVGINFNGKYTGVREISFDKDGIACLDDMFVDAFSVKKDLLNISKDTGCIDIKSVSQLDARYERTENTLHVSIPDYYLDSNSDFKNMQSGGFGTFLNYNVNMGRGVSGSSTSDTMTALMTWGANIGNYLFRSDFSYGSFSSSSGLNYSNFSLNNAYVETDVAETYRVRAGYISVGNTLFGAGQIHGFHIDNNVGMHGGDSTVRVSGTASDYAQVEVFQQGRLIFSRPVPAGAFTFEAVPLHTTYADAEVVVRETAGGEQRFVIPKAAFSVSSEMVSRFSAFAGMMDSTRGLGTGPLLGIEYRFPFIERMQPFVGTLLTKNYIGAGVGTDISLMPFNTRGNTNLSVSRSGNKGDLGMRFSSNLSAQFGTMNPYLSFSWQSGLYRDLGLSQQDILAAENGWDLQDIRSFAPRYSFSAGVSKPLTERLSAGVALSTNTYYSQPTSNSLSTSLTYASRRFTLSGNLNYGWTQTNQGQPGNKMWSAFVNLRVPFTLGGKPGSSTSYVSRYGDTMRYGTRIDQQITDNLKLGGGAEMTQATSTNTSSMRHFAQAFWRTPYTNTSAYYSGTSNNSRSYSMNLSGAVVATGSDFVLVPDRVQDTFAVVDTGVKGFVGVDTPTARVVTNYDGKTVVPQLFEGKPNVVNIVTKTLPDGAYVKNPRQEISVKRGAVGRINYTSDQARQYLVKIAAGQVNFPMGTEVLSDKAESIGYLVDENILMLDEHGIEMLSQGDARLTAGGGPQCRIGKQKIDSSASAELIEIEASCAD